MDLNFEMVATSHSTKWSSMLCCRRHHWSTNLNSIGTFANILSFLVMSRKSFQGSTTSILFRILAVIDTLTLWVVLPQIFARGMYDITMMNLSWAACKFLPFLGVWLGDCSAWILMTIVSERVICIFLPHKVKDICTPGRYIAIVVLIMLILAAINSTNIFFVFIHDVVGDDNVTIVEIQCWRSHLSYFQHIYPIVRILTFCGLPFGFIFLSNLAIILRLSYAAVIRRRDMNTGAAGPPMSNMTLMLIGCSILFLGFTLPYSIRYTLANLDIPFQRVYIMSYVGNWLSYCNNGFNFFVYCLTGKKFRQELRQLFSCCCRTSDAGLNSKQESVSTLSTIA